MMAAFICLGLVSTVSAMMWIGPRVTVAMGEDLGILTWLSRRMRAEFRRGAILAQFVIVNVMLLTATFQSVVELRAVQSHALLRAHRDWSVRSALATTRNWNGRIAFGDILSRR